MIFLNLFFEFFKTGLFAIGGGMTTIPFLFEMGERTKWFSSQELTDMIAVSESTPGPIGINMASFVGFRVAGLPGAFSSTFGLVFPSFIISLIIAGLLHSYKEKQIVKVSFFYLRACVVGLISFALYQLMTSSLISGGNINLIYLLFYVILTVLIVLFKKVHPVIWIAAGALFGLLFV